MKGAARREEMNRASGSDGVKGLIEEGVKFHGHLGPFLILGLKAGLFANNLLGKDYFETHVIVETEPHPPFSCVVDGLQVTTGCTMGKRNIKLMKGGSLSITFRRKGKRLKVCLKDDVLKDLIDLKSKEEAERKALDLLDRSIFELFNVEEHL
jgi:formylmethanofuran dehydrogenase subunit E